MSLFSSASEEDTDSEDKENDLDYWQLCYFFEDQQIISCDSLFATDLVICSFFRQISELLFKITSLFAKNEVEMNIIEKLDNLDNLDILAVSQFWTILGYWSISSVFCAISSEKLISTDRSTQKWTHPLMEIQILIY